ncbi:MAG: helix-hairpin-helix protein [Acidobacteria bacterium]|nr:helix-hairpin-helix protein [Acidobacteriota bacterium]
MELFDSAGQRIAIEPELFRGGEGTIHPVAGNSRLLAKLYHQKIDAAKQAKLAAMAGGASDGLLRVAAWPTATLHSGPSGRMVGFVMPRFDGQRYELHHLYRPGTRKQSFRQADWSFLIQAARNVAAAVATVHGAGHVVGDVNQRNFIVGGDATVKVLDCDSFQIRGSGRIFHCPVGVPEFTPPELQGRPLEGIERTPSHDAFGLAVLAFQLLFMGRHPFAGRFLGVGDMPIERAIAEGRFAFGKGSRARLMEPPPNMVTFESLPPRLGALFEAAFGGGTARPSAADWSGALDAANAALRACSAEPMHKYSNTLPDCPWCALEGAGGVYFFIGRITEVTSFDLGRLWAEITTATALPYEAPIRPAMRATGTPPTMAFAVRRMAIFAKLAGVLTLGGLAIAAPEWIILLLGAIVIVAILPLPGAGERKQRMARLRDAERAWKEAYAKAEAAVSVEPLLRRRTELQRLKATYESVGAERQNELANLTRNAREIQLHHYLEQHRIRGHDIPDIGPKRKATLAAWGIDTAADLTWQAVGAVQGFGPALQARLMGWRAFLESRFVFDAKQAIPQQNLDAVEYRWRRRKAELEQQLRAGAEQARRATQAIRERRLTVASELESPARDWAQAAADLDVINRALSWREGRS